MSALNYTSTIFLLYNLDKLNSSIRKTLVQQFKQYNLITKCCSCIFKCDYFYFNQRSINSINVEDRKLKSPRQAKAQDNINRN